MAELRREKLPDVGLRAFATLQHLLGFSLRTEQVVLHRNTAMRPVTSKPKQRPLCFSE